MLRRIEIVGALGMLVAVAVLTTEAVSRLPPVTTQPQAAPTSPSPVMTGTVTATPPFTIDLGMLLTIEKLPTALTDTIDAATYSKTEIIDAQSVTKVPLEPMAPMIEDGWCLTVYPEVTITLYVQPYIAPKGAIWVKEGDYVPGEQRTGRINHFLALERRGEWELYYPDVYPWSSLGCH